MKALTPEQLDRITLIKATPTLDLLDGERRAEELLSVDLKPDELISYGEIVSRQRQEIAAIEAKLAQQKKELTAAIEAREAVIDSKCQAQLSKSEMRMVECIDLLSVPRPGKKTRVRLDTLEVVLENLMSDSELQRMLRFEEREEAKKADSEAQPELTITEEVQAAVDAPETEPPKKGKAFRKQPGQE